MGINEYMLAQHFDVRRACWVSAELVFLFVCFFGGCCAGSLGLLCCCLGFFLVAVSRSHLVVVHGLFIAVASLVAKHRL